MAKYKKKRSQGRAIALFVLGLTGFSLLIALLLRGTNIALLNPKGWIAAGQFNLMLFTVALLLTIGIPTLVVLYFFAWRYRESNEKVKYEPNLRHGRLLVFSMWAIPLVFALALMPVMWSATHKLHPKQPIVADAKPLTIQVVAMRWKWLFIYPEQKIASVNHVQIPAGVPVKFELTADEAPMSSFWIPNLGGQLYAMTGHVSPLHLMASEPGDYRGSSAEINGTGFSGMKFTARASSKVEFDGWVQQAKQSPEGLDMATYNELVKPSESHPVILYSSYEPNLYAKVTQKYYTPQESQEHKE